MNDDWQFFVFDRKFPCNGQWLTALSLVWGSLRLSSINLFRLNIIVYIAMWYLVTVECIIGMVSGITNVTNVYLQSSLFTYLQYQIIVFVTFDYKTCLKMFLSLFDVINNTKAQNTVEIIHFTYLFSNEHHVRIKIRI